MITLSHVRRYQELGFVVHPLCSPEHRCQSPGKIPYDPVAGQHMGRWQDHGQFSEDQWQEWIDYDSEINIGFLCGSPSEILAIDIDDDGGRELLNELYPEWRRTWCYTTGKGLRVLFRTERRVQSRIFTRGDRSFEVLGDGRQSVLPPSLHPSGRRYEWLSGSSPRDCGLSGDTGWLEQPDVHSGGIDSELEEWAEFLKQRIPNGQRNNTMTRIAGHLLAPHYCTRQEAIVWLDLLNREMCKPPFPMKELETIVASIGKSEARGSRKWRAGNQRHHGEAQHQL